jgi:hypothetical protein
MNEQIRQLARQADAMAREIITDLREIPVYNRIRDEKFAELIIEECSTVIEQNLFQNIGYNTSRAVRKHFGIGVEE